MVTRDHDGGLGVPGPVMVERVRDISQRRRRAGSFHPVGEPRRERSRALRRLTRYHQRGYPWSGSVRRGRLWGLFDDHVSIRPTEAE